MQQGICMEFMTALGIPLMFASRLSALVQV